MRNTAMQKNNYSPLFIVYTIQALNINILIHVFPKVLHIFYIKHHYNSNYFDFLHD